jgi:hypothetical protein
MMKNRLQELAGIIPEGALDPANEENIFDNLIDTDHSELVNKLLEAADANPSLTLVDFLKTFDIGAGEEDDLNEVEEDESTTNPYEEAISYLEDISKKGELTPDQIKDIIRRLTSARKKFFTSQRTPDSYKAATKNSAITRAQGKVDMEKMDAYLKADREKVKAREDAGLLPPKISIYPSYGYKLNYKFLKYYNSSIVNTGYDGDLVTYTLRDEFINTKPLDGAPIPYDSVVLK